MLSGWPVHAIGQPFFLRGVLDVIRSATIDDVLTVNPCEGYKREKLTALWAGRESLSAEELAQLDIPIHDRVWVICNVLIPDQLDSIKEWIIGKIPSDELKKYVINHKTNDITIAVRVLEHGLRRGPLNFEIQSVLDEVVRRVNA